MAKTADIEVFRVGSQCRVGGSIPGVITGINIRGGNRILYEVDWWENRTHKCEWMESFLVEQTQDNRDTSRIGFIAGT